jgi:cytochrome P450
MSALNLDRERIRELFDLRRIGTADGKPRVTYEEDPHPAFHRLRETGPVQVGIPHELIGFDHPATFHGIPDIAGRPHFSVFSFAVCDAVYKNDRVFRSSAPEAQVGEGAGIFASMIYMNGPPHRRYRSLVQPSFVPAKAKWWMENWINHTVHSLIDGFEGEKKAELNVDFDAAIPILTITGSFGLTVEQALEVRATGGAVGGQVFEDLLMPIIRDRRVSPQDDLVSVLCQAELQDEEGSHRLSDDEILAFSSLLLSAGSGTTWKQMGITLIALLTTPGALDAVRADRSLLRQAIEESLRWNVTDPVFSRWSVEDYELGGVKIPAGSNVHLAIGAANRDPARWDDPDTYDVRRPVKSHLGFANGSHICLGMHVARAELTTAIGALIDRLPNLRLDPDAETPKVIGMYERGPDEIHVIWD